MSFQHPNLKAGCIKSYIGKDGEISDSRTAALTVRMLPETRSHHTRMRGGYYWQSRVYSNIYIYIYIYLHLYLFISIPISFSIPLAVSIAKCFAISIAISVCVSTCASIFVAIGYRYI